MPLFLRLKAVSFGNYEGSKFMTFYFMCVCSVVLTRVLVFVCCGNFSLKKILQATSTPYLHPLFEDCWRKRFCLFAICICLFASMFFGLCYPPMRMPSYNWLRAGMRVTVCFFLCLVASCSYTTTHFWGAYRLTCVVLGKGPWNNRNYTARTTLACTHTHTITHIYKVFACSFVVQFEHIYFSIPPFRLTAVK